MSTYGTCIEAGFHVARTFVEQNPNLPMIGETSLHSMLSTPSFDRTKPHIRLAPTVDDICVSAVTRDGVWGERVGRTVAVEYRDRVDVAFVLSDDYRAKLQAAVDAKLAEIAALADVQ